MRILVLQHGLGPDYLADIVWIILATKDGIQLATNIIPDYLYETAENLQSVYGKGFTLYGKLDSQSKPQHLSESDIKNLFACKAFDLVIYTSIRRYSSFFQIACDSLGADKVLVFDGEDDQIIEAAYAVRSTYYKRELSLIGRLAAMPVSFCLPKVTLDSIRRQLPVQPSKSTLLAPCDPRDKKTYIYNSEIEYYTQYSQSLFGYTCKKAGWDCLRHYEIIACGCLPYFECIAFKPRFTMCDYPVMLQIEANRLFNRIHSQRLHALTPELREKYNTLSSAFSRYIERAALRNSILYSLNPAARLALPPLLLSRLAIFFNNLSWRLYCKYRRIHHALLT